ncbi:MAG: amidophosphoribosyltransferase [Alphaproteobacteria bacterium]
MSQPSACSTNPWSDDDKLHEECAVFAIHGHRQAAALTVLGLHALQHRGQEATGIVSFDGEQFNTHRALGLVGDNFSSSEVVEKLHGHAAIGHNRYATSGDTVLRNVQPLFADFDCGGFAIGHNGNLTNARQLRQQLIKDGAIFHSTTDTEVILHLVAKAKGTSFVQRLVTALTQIEGAYSLVCIAKDKIIGLRDPHGIRPLVLGKVNDAYVLASETCALDIIGGDYIRDIKPGEMVVVDADGVHSQFPFTPKTSRFCIFEYIYFARPDSWLEGRSVYAMRKRIGMELAKESAVLGADVIVPVPDSGVPSALGFAEASGVPFELGIIRNHYVGRTFIEPTDHIRHFGVKLKHNANRKLLEGKSVVLVDDSIVRGTTSMKIVDMVRQAGAKEVHMRISSPPTTHSCFYGIDTPEQERLLAHRFTVEEMAKHIGVDSLAFISMDGLYRAMGEAKRDVNAPAFCDACFTGDYPIRLSDKMEASDQEPVTRFMERQV